MTRMDIVLLMLAATNFYFASRARRKVNRIVTAGAGIVVVAWVVLNTIFKFGG